MFTPFSPLSGLSMDLLTPNQPQPLPSSSLNNKRKEREKIKRQKYKLKKKLQKSKKKQKKSPSPLNAKCTRAWKWRTLKSTSLQIKQKRLLFKVHNLRATTCKYHLQLCKIEKSKIPKLCHNKGFRYLITEI